MRFLGLACALGAEHDIRLLVPARPSTDARLVAELESTLQAPVEVFPAPPPPSPGRAAVVARWARALTYGVPPWIAAHFRPELERRARALAPAVDVAVLLDDYAGVYARGIASLSPVVADKSNVMGWSAAQGLPARGLSERVRRSLSVRLSRRFERRYTRHAATIVVTSEEERRRFETLYGRRPEAVVPSAIDLPAEAGDPASNRIGWLGTHEYPPNVEGLVRFVEQAWEPLGRDGFRLRIAGGSPTAEVRALERFPGVEVLGYVERLDDFLAGLAAAVVPLWRGAGVKVKTLTFMGAGIPVAATPVAVEGIAAESGRHCLVSDDPAGLARALREIVNGELGRPIGAEARRLVSERYTWEHIGPRFVEVVERTATAADRG